MKLSVGFLAAAVLIGSSSASPLETRQSGSGSGPYGPGTYKTDNSLSGHTIYYPTNAPSTEKLPVLIWGNGACSTQGTSNSALLQNIASYGFIAIAEGPPNGGGTSDASTMAQAINWAAQSQSGWPNKDGSKIMTAGFSCGGVEAEDNFQNQYVKTVGVVSSGLLSNPDAAKNFKKPVLFILGGTSDIAYQNGERDYGNVPAGVPAWKGNINVGHGGTLGDKDGGRFGKVLLNWLLYVFKGQTSGLDYLKGGYSVDGWSVQSKSLNLLVPFGGSSPSPTATPTATATNTATKTSTTPPPATSTASSGGSALYGQCGGKDWTGSTTCASGTCKYSNPYYSQCLP